MQPRIIGHIGARNAMNRHKKSNSVICVLSCNKPDLIDAKIPQAHDKPYKISVISTISWSSLISLIGNGLKNSNPIIKIAISATKQKIKFFVFVSIAFIFLINDFCVK